MGFGKSNYNGGGGTNYFTIKAGDHGATSHNYYRILPAYGKLEQSGKWFVYFAQHFGYRGQSASGEGDGVMRPFKCIREKDRKTKMITTDCPECLNRESIEAQKEKLESQLAAEGKGEAEVKSATKEYMDWLKSHNVDKKFYVAAMNQKREFGVLKLPFEAKDKLEKKIKELVEKEQIDATDVEQGVWFDIQRSGDSFINTSYDVEVVMDNVPGEGGRKYKVIKMEPLSVEEQDRAIKSLPELVDLPRVLTETQIQALVDCSGEPAEVDSIMGVAAKQGTAERAANRMVPPPSSTVSHVGGPAASAIRAPAQHTAAAAPAPTGPTAETDDEREFREFKEAKAKRQAAAAPPQETKAAAEGPELKKGSAAGFQAPKGRPSAADFAKKYGFNPDEAPTEAAK